MSGFPPAACARPTRHPLPGALALGVLLLLAAPGPLSAAPPSGEPGLDRIAAEHYDPAFLARGGAFHRPLYVLYFIETALLLVVAWALALGPLGGWGRSVLAAAGGHRWLARLVLVSAVVAGFSLLRLPFSIYSFLHARAYGLRHDAWTGFAGDWLKAVAIGWVLAVVVGVLVLGLFAGCRGPGGRGRRGGGGAGGGLRHARPPGHRPDLQPVPSPRGPALEERLLDIAREGGVPAREVLVADASRRTRAVNAYFTGLGHTRRIVLYDTLVQGFPPDEIALVVAHEVGHWRRHHVTGGWPWGWPPSCSASWSRTGFWDGAGGGLRGLAGRADPALVVPAYALYSS